MRTKFKKGETVIVHGSCEDDGTFYYNVHAKVLECDPFFKDYRVRFNDNTEAWFFPQYLKKIKEKKSRQKRKKRRR